jgi:hypothetical protein
VAISVNSLFIASGVAVAPDGSFSQVVRMPGTVGAGQVGIEATQTGPSGTKTTASTTFDVTPSAPAPKSYPAPAVVQPPTGIPPGAGPLTTGTTGTTGGGRNADGGTTAHAPTTTSTTATRSSSHSTSSTPATGDPRSAATTSASSGIAPWVVPVAIGAALVIAGAVYALWRRRRPAS